jgi:hypothetical protein
MHYLGPPLLGGIALFAIVGVRLLAKLPSLVRNPALRIPSLAILAAACGAGRLAGVAYVVLGRPARRLRVVGPYLAGVITIAAYMGALVVASLFSSDPLVKNNSDLFLYVGIAVCVGIFAGHRWFQEKAAPTRSPEPPAA